MAPANDITGDSALHEAPTPMKDKGLQPLVPPRVRTAPHLAPAGKGPAAPGITGCLFVRELVLLLFLLLMFGASSLFIEGFWDWPSLLRRSRYWAATGMVAVPMTFIISTAGIDLSVGSMMALSGITLGLLYNDAHWPIAWAACAAVAVGIAAGAFNGTVISYGRVPPLVATLATMALFRGIAMGLSRARSLKGFPDRFTWLGQGNVLDVFGTRGNGPFVPVSFLVMLGMFAIGGLLLRRTWIGRFAECIGENETAAEFAAIDVRRMKLVLYTACGLACGLAALFHTALYATAKADTARGLELEAIACVVVGGTRISGGRGSMSGALFGLLIIGILRHGLLMAEVKSQYIIICVGLLLIVAAILNERLAARRSEK